MNSPAPRLHFVALVSIDFDIDLLPYFIPHYTALGCDNYCLFIHEGKSNDNSLWAEKSAKEFGWKTRFVPREASHQNGELKKALVNKFRQAVKPHDYIITADADEFQKWETDPREAMEAGDHVVVGKRIDRFNEKLLGIDHAEDLEVTFPLESENLSDFIFPKKKRAREKIVMARADMPVDYRKCAALRAQSGFTPQVGGTVPILHYKWRNNLLRRLSDRPDYAPEEVAAIKSFFEV